MITILAVELAIMAVIMASLCQGFGGTIFYEEEPEDHPHIQADGIWSDAEALNPDGTRKDC